MGSEGRRTGPGDDLEEEFLGGAARPALARTLDVLGAVVPLPDATLRDLVDEQVPRWALASAGGWQEWLTQPSGRDTWLEDPAGFSRMPETNYMARAAAGTEANGYAKTGETLQGLDVWRKR